ncbi:hypothetical protein O3M35_000244 [Rhynocoris fuscipes]|uniref:Uncharacterized protein n=1 Tax=Rhynocoris fuscipes TaxID=488301 RepID=A0AAW1DSD6_9HEMI
MDIDKETKEGREECKVPLEGRFIQMLFIVYSEVRENAQIHSYCIETDPLVKDIDKESKKGREEFKASYRESLPH